jgi:transcriptional antiterminator NusG
MSNDDHSDKADPDFHKPVVNQDVGDHGHASGDLAVAANVVEGGVSSDVVEEVMHWYVLKVQSNREKSIKEAICRKIKLDQFEHFFGDIIIPTEKVVDTKGGKKKVREVKLYPGYLMIKMIMNEDTWYLVRNISGVGDFTGANGKPIPMRQHEIDRMLGLEEVKEAEPTKVKIGFASGDIVKIREGTFESFSGTIEAVDETNGKVSVLIEIFGRPTPVELDYWQVESV